MRKTGFLLPLRLPAEGALALLRGLLGSGSAVPTEQRRDPQSRSVTVSFAGLPPGTLACRRAVDTRDPHHPRKAAPTLLCTSANGLASHQSLATGRIGPWRVHGLLALWRGRSATMRKPAPRGDANSG